MADLLGEVLADLVARSHRATPLEVAGLVDGAAQALGMDAALLYLADVQQRLLVPLPRSPGTSGGGTVEPIPIEGTVAGWAYRKESVRLSRHGVPTLWLPLVDGVERIGVLQVTAGRLTARLLHHAEILASVAAVIVVGKSGFSDLYALTTRQRSMTTAAEMVWAFLPPRTLGTHQVTSTAVMEPAYEVGGDAFDHGLHDSRLYLTVVDAMGHDLASGLCSAVALATCRATRLADGTLTDIAEQVDAELDHWLPDRILTGVFAELDLDSGRLSWVNCGHPPPLLIRGHHVIPQALEAPSQLPLGLGPGNRDTLTVHRAQLEPGDRILIHTDGVTEARSQTGELFGEQRLADFVTRSLSAGEPAPEALRRLIHTILDHHQGRLRDDATIVLVEWHPAPDDEPAPHAAGVGRRG
ncbi:PP2C family protein-serine/threonine phosphatase [Streptomyces sp. NPDC093060]|uniref:PP2C family protein-serine/threonine phosphatase n=1 Tax=Streptomyces sp. NPDC093060 TaxID=3366019 RepID=UPI0038052516